MARIETWFEQDLKKPVPVRKLEGVFNEDSQANVIGVQLYDDGVVLTSISGSVTGDFLLADGTTTSISGTKSGGKASVVIPPAAYKVTGPITITVRITDGSNITTVCACVGLVMLTKTPVAIPAGSTVADWSAQISAQLAACQAAADAVGATVAVTFNEAVANDAGTYVTSGGHMYYLPDGHTANVSLANTTKVETNCGNEFTSLNNSFTKSSHVLYGETFNVKRNTAVTYNFDFIAGREYRILNGNATTAWNIKANGTAKYAGQLTANGVYILSCAENCDTITFYADATTEIMVLDYSTLLLGEIRDLDVAVFGYSISAKRNTAKNFLYNFVAGKKYKIINGAYSAAMNTVINSTSAPVDVIGNVNANATYILTATANADALRVYASDDETIIIKEVTDIETNIPDGSITMAKLADGAVTTAKVGSKAITLAKLADEVGTQFTNGANIQNGTISKAALTNALIQFIESAGGGTITNNADDETIKVNEDSELYVNPDAFNIVFVDTDTAYSSVISRISAISGKVVLMLKGNITGLADNTNFPSNLMMVIGLGGVFETTRTTDTRVYFPEGCLFICGNYRFFNSVVMPRCTSGYLDGEAKVIWWGAVADGETVVTSIFSCLNLSTFKVLRFTPGVYRGYFNNTLDGRTLIFDEGAIIDGVVHIAYGSSLGASTKRWCKNTKVIGKVVSTVRVGGAQIDGLSIPDGIEILGTNSSYHSQTSEGGPKGVHWHFGCKNIEIGEIVVHEVVNLSAGYSYALGIDTETNEEIPHNIHIERVIAGENTSSYYDVLISKAYNISIGEIIAESGTGMTDSLCINNNAHDIEIGKLTTKFAVNSIAKSAVLLGNVEDVKLGTINIVPDVSAVIAAWGIFFNACRNVFVESVHTKYMAQGLRLVNAVNALVVSHISENDTTPSANSGSTYQILKTFS